MAALKQLAARENLESFKQSARFYDVFWKVSAAMEGFVKWK
jgi:hypothetical protein